MVETYTSKDLKPVLMNGARAEVKNPYYLIKSEDQVIFVISPGRNGIEFNKTVGYFSNFPSGQSFQSLYGQGILIMQRNDDFGVKEFRVVLMNTGRQILVPAGWGVCLVNTGAGLLVVIRNSNIEDKYLQDKSILEKKGFAYYIVEKKGEISFEENPNYSFHPQITTE